MKKRVSVVIPVKDSQRTIGEAVRSLLEQSYGSENLEIILVGDPGDPTFGPLAAEIASGQVLAVEVAVDSPGRDANAKRNVGLARATGDVGDGENSIVFGPPQAAAMRVVARSRVRARRWERATCIYDDCNLRLRLRLSGAASALHQ